MAAPSTVLTIVKQMSYRGRTDEEWSNTYALSGPTPADATAWRTLFNALVLQEKTVYTSQCVVVGGYGYNRIPQTGDHAIWSVDLLVSPNAPVAGTLAPGGVLPAGDQAAWVRWGLDRFNTNGKRVYLRKYFHVGQVAGSGGDGLLGTYSTALQTFGAKMRDGTFVEGRTVVDKNGLAPVNHGVSPFITTRTLKRRGKRPPTSG